MSHFTNYEPALAQELAQYLKPGVNPLYQKLLDISTLALQANQLDFAQSLGAHHVMAMALDMDFGAYCKTLGEQFPNFKGNLTGKVGDICASGYVNHTGIFQFMHSGLILDPNGTENVAWSKLWQVGPIAIEPVQQTYESNQNIHQGTLWAHQYSIAVMPSELFVTR